MHTCVDNIIDTIMRKTSNLATDSIRHLLILFNTDSYNEIT